MTTETIKHEPHDSDAWVCLCGNRPDLHGFYPCDKTGTYVEPTLAAWQIPRYVCDRCGRIINQSTLAVEERETRP